MPWIGIGAGARLERAAAKDVRAGLCDRAGDRVHPLRALRRRTARRSSPGCRRRSSRPPTSTTLGCGMGLAAGQLVGRQHAASPRPRRESPESGLGCEACDSSPMTPMIVRYVPRLRWALRPSDSTRSMTCSICSSVTPDLRMMITVWPESLGNGTTLAWTTTTRNLAQTVKKRRGELRTDGD